MAFQGLTSTEALTRQNQYGLNSLPSDEKRSFARSAWAIISEPMIILLISAGIINLILAKPIDAILLSTTIVIIVGISIYQERRTERALAALQDLTAPQALVIRDGIESRIPSSHVVAGDLLVLVEGDRVAADGQIISASSLHIDESLLTGESVAVEKSAEADVSAGTLVVKGHGRAIVTQIGINTRIGKIGRSIREIPFQRTLLQREIDRLVKVIGVIGFLAVAIIIVVYGSTRHDWLEGALAGIAAAMALIPEEFPVILTLFLAIGAWRMSRVRVIARKSAAIETLGSMTALCVDKTGTLTMNQMSVSAFILQGEKIELEEARIPDRCREIAWIASLAAPEQIFDPMDRAFRSLSENYLQSENMKSLREYPLERDRLAYIHIWQDAKILAAAKGAPEEIARLARLSENELRSIETEVSRAADAGYRVLAIAKAELTHEDVIPADPRDLKYSFLGLALLRDPIRPGVIEAVQECASAGIRTIMITGDHRNTAIAIARDIGLSEPEKCLTGIEIEHLSDQEVESAIAGTNVFARVSPEHKLKIVRALQRNGEVVGMTGDGVNDAPALRAAEIGMAMGGRGTDVAREASALIITDDNFTSIVGGIRSGRTIYANLQKAMTYVIAIHIPIFGIALAPVLNISWPLILLPALVAFHEIIIDPACSIVFEEEPADPSIMRRKPRAVDSRLLDREDLTIAISQGFTVFLGVFSIFLFAVWRDYNEERIRSLAFGTLLIANLFLILVNRSRSLTVMQTLLTRRNPSVPWISLLVLTVLLTLFNIPLFRKAFRLAQLTITDYLLISVIALLTLAWFELWKVRRSFR
jgi:Ca2+-transporting ATPase